MTGDLEPAAERWAQLAPWAPSTGSRAVRRWLACLRVALTTQKALRKESWRREDSIERGAASIQAMGSAICEIHNLRIIVRGDAPPSPSVIVANHVSYLDPLAISAVVANIAISKHEVQNWPIIGSTSREAGTLFVDRANTTSRAAILRKAIGILSEGVSVLNFPEGTTSPGDRILPFSRGIFGAARIARVPVVPVFVEYRPRWLAWFGNSAFLGHYICFSLLEHAEVLLHFGAPLSSANAASSEALACEARTALASLGRIDLSPSTGEPLRSAALR